jgi:hypothetical protein
MEGSEEPALPPAANRNTISLRRFILRRAGDGGPGEGGGEGDGERGSKDFTPSPRSKLHRAGEEGYGDGGGEGLGDGTGEGDVGVS